MLQERIKRSTNHRNSESDTDGDISNSFTTIELNPADITVHHTPVPEVTNDDEDENEVYRKAASLGDLSKYENKSSSTLERAQSLDMTDTGSKKRKAPVPPPEDIHESTEDLTKLDHIDTFDRRKLKKSSEWGTLEDAIWSGPGEEPPNDNTTRNRKKSSGSNGGTLERSKSNVEIKVTRDESIQDLSSEPLNVSDGLLETSIELYNLPLSKKLTQDFIRAERLFDPDEDNALARLVNDGEVIKTPTAEQVEVEFRKSHPPPKMNKEQSETEHEHKSPEETDSFEKAVHYFDMHTKALLDSNDTKVNLTDPPEELYAGKKEVVEEPISKVHVNFGCPGCDNHHGQHTDSCSKKDKSENNETSYHQTIKVEEIEKSDSEQPKNKKASSDTFETYFAKPLTIEAGSKSDEEDEDVSREMSSSVTVNDENVTSSPVIDTHNVSSVNISSDIGKMTTQPVASSPVSLSDDTPKKMTYITEIKVSPSSDKEENETEDENALSDSNEEIVSIMENIKKQPELSASSVKVSVTSNGKLPAGKKPPVPPRRSDAARYYVPKSDPTSSEKQIVYVSEYKSPSKEEKKPTEKKFENWIFVKDDGKEHEINPWGNGSSTSQPVTNIVLSSSSDEKINQQ